MKKPHYSGVVGKLGSATIILVAVLLLAGCQRPPAKTIQAERFGIEPDNVLEIPGPDTIFEYEDADIKWNDNIGTHPRILATPESVELLKNNPENEITVALIESANKNKALIEADPTFREATAPVTCAWAYLLTDDEKYLDAVRRSLTWLLDFPPLVKVPEGANIPWLEQANSLGGVYDLLYSKFTPDERATIEGVLRDTVFHTLAYKVTEYNKEINFWALEPQTNYYVVFHSTAGLIATDLIGVEPDAEALAGHCWSRIQDSMKLLDEENGWREGLTYLDFCWGQSACYFLLALERNSDLKPYNEPWFMKSVEWAFYGALPNHKTIACFGDNEPENYSVGSYMYRAGALLAFDFFIQQSRKTAEVQDLALDLPIFGAAALDREKPQMLMSNDYFRFMVPVPAKYFPGIEWGVIRYPAEPLMTSIGTSFFRSNDDFYLALKSGYAGYDHNHLDQGSMILAAFGEILLSDPGRGGPDIIRKDPEINCLFEAGLGHNTLIVGDGCYEDLGLFPDNPEYFSRKGTITSFDGTEAYIQFTTDNSGLYPTEPLSDFRRTFIYLTPGTVEGAPLGVLIIADRVGFYEETEHSMLFHTPGNVEILGDARARFINKRACLEYFGFCTVDTIDKAERQATSWAIRDSICYFRSVASPVRNSDWVHVLIPARIDADGKTDVPEPSIEMFALGTKISWENYEIKLMLKPDIGWVVSDLPDYFEF